MKRSKRKGAKEEDYFFEKLKDVIPDLKYTVNSGAANGDGDLKSPYLYIDVKSKESAGLPTISAEDLEKIRLQALEHGKSFIIPIKSTSFEGLIVPLDLGIEMLERLYDDREECKCSKGSIHTNKEDSRTEGI